MHIKGKRFGFPIIRRMSALNHRETYHVSWNAHAGIEIHYVLKGNFAWELLESGATRGASQTLAGRLAPQKAVPLVVTGGTFGIVPAHVRHRARGDNGTPAVRLGLILERPSPALAEGTPFSPDDLRRIFRRFRDNGGTIRRCSPRLAAILRDLVDALTIENATNPEGQLTLRLLSSALLHETYAALGDDEAPAKGHDVMPKMRTWIDEHYAEKISLPRLVKLSGYGRSQFFKLFLAETGMTPNDYLTRVRIERAKALIRRRAQSETLLSIALACGFNSAAVFATTFRRHVGVSPMRYRALSHAAASEGHAPTGEFFARTPKPCEPRG